MFTISRSVVRTLLFVVLQLPAQRPPAEPSEFSALQAHFERTTQARHESLFRDINTVPQWEERKRTIRRQLERMLWHDFVWPSQPPAARITKRTDYSAYTVENIVLETGPKIYST